jgi:hypothetical protein
LTKHFGLNILFIERSNSPNIGDSYVTIRLERFCKKPNNYLHPFHGLRMEGVFLLNKKGAGYL